VEAFVRPLSSSAASDIMYSHGCWLLNFKPEVCGCGLFSSPTLSKHNPSFRRKFGKLQLRNGARTERRCERHTFHGKSMDLSFKISAATKEF
jgi:hypothetical protein